MVICIKCVTEQTNKTKSICEYDGKKKAEPEHNWMDRGEFIDELRKKLPSFIKERIVELKKKYAEKQAQFNVRVEYYSKRVDALKADYDVYCNEELPSEVEKLKKRAVRSYLHNLIGSVIGGAISLPIFFKWGFPMFNIELTPSINFQLLVIVGIFVLIAIFIGKPLVEYLKTKRNVESRSQMFADELTDKWLDINGFNKLESDFEAEKDEWNNISGSYERVIHSAECALVGSGEELLEFYKKDKKTRHWYVENIAEWF